MKTIYKFAATLLLLATLVSCAPSAEQTSSAEPSSVPSGGSSPEPSATTSTVPTTVSDFDYRRYTNPQSTYYPEWAQPYSTYVYIRGAEITWLSSGTEGKFAGGGYLSKEELEADPAKLASFLDYDSMTPVEPNTMVSYDADGHIMPESLLYRHIDGSYQDEPQAVGAEEMSVSEIIVQRTIGELPRSEDDINLSYDEYFSEPRALRNAWYAEAHIADEDTLNYWATKTDEHGVEWFAELASSSGVTSFYLVSVDGWADGYVDTAFYYTDGGSIYTRRGDDETPETLYTAEDGVRVMSVGGDDVVLFFMTDAYDIYRIHLPSGTLDYICSAAYDYDAALDKCGRYIIEQRWVEDKLGRYPWQEPYEGTYEQWITENDCVEMVETAKQWWRMRLPTNGMFQILSNNDVRFTVPPNDDYILWDYISPYIDEGWFSSGDSEHDFCGDYVVYSAALKKYGAPERVDLPSDDWNWHTWQRRNRMSFEEFVEYFGGYPPYSLF